VTERHERRHGLEAFVDKASRADGAALEIRIRGDLGHLNLRGRPDGDFMRACENALGQPLPLKPNTFTSGEARIYWLGPDEWLVIGNTAHVDELAVALESALAGLLAAVNKLSGGQIALHVAGSGCRRLFAKGCTLDFHPSVFAKGCSAQSGLARANVLFGCIDESEFELVVRRSFADYLLRWLSLAGEDHGIRVIDS
jgi:sarcosine oxidase subunit gamma